MYDIITFIKSYDMAISFKNILDFKKLGLFKKEKSVLGLDIGTSSIKVVQLRRQHGKAVLETYGELSLGPYAKLEVGQATSLNADQITEAIEDLFKEANVTTRRASVSIPLRSSLLKVIQVPSVGEKQIQKVVPLEARKYIPVPISEVALDWWVIPETRLPGSADSRVEDEEEENEKKNMMTDVLVVAIHNETLAKYRDIVSKANLEARSLEVETFSEIRSVVGHEIVPTVILDIGAGTTKMTIVDYGIVRVSHTINKGSQDLTVAISKSLGISFGEAEKIKRKYGLKGESSIDEQKNAQMANVTQATIDFIFYEANRVLTNYQKTYNRLAKKVILTGGGSLLDGLVEVAQKTFSAEVVIGDPFSKTEAPAFLLDVLEVAGPEFAISVGLALKELQQN